ncbi:hypothetical protein KAR48_03985 [bacterium]|nr:hypothetical protein [bacterium]
MRGSLLNRIQHQLNKENGASLVEVVLLLVILAIALVPLTQLSVSNLKFGAQYSLMTRAISFAQSRMEEVIADYKATGAGRGYAWTVANWAGSSDSPATGFTRSVSISGEMTLNGVNYVTVQVSVANTNISTVKIETILVK